MRNRFRTPDAWALYYHVVAAFSALVRARQLDPFAGERSEVGLRTTPYENSSANSESLRYRQRPRSIVFAKGCKSIRASGQEMYPQAVVNGVHHPISRGDSAQLHFA